MKVKLLWFCVCFLPLSALAAVIDIVPVQVGLFEKENCVSESKYPNSCLCGANVFKAVVGGISTQAAQKINDTLTRLGGASDDLCEGHKINADAENTGVYRALGYEMIFNKASFLTIRKWFGGYYAGTPHPFAGEAYYFFNTKTGDTYSYRDLFGDNLGALNSAIKIYLETDKQKMAEMGGSGNGEEVFDEAKDRLESGWINADMIDKRAHNFYLAEKGLIYTLNFGKYISSDVEVVLPVEIIKNNEVRKYVESMNAKN